MISKIKTWLKSTYVWAILAAVGLLAYKFLTSKRTRQARGRQENLQKKMDRETAKIEQTTKKREALETKTRKAEKEIDQKVKEIKEKDHEKVADWIDSWNSSNS